MISPTISNGKIGPKILVLGASGMLGDCVIKYLQQQGHVATWFTREDYDPEVDSLCHIHKIIRGYDFVINCMGVIRPTWEDDNSCFYVNSYIPKMLKKICDFTWAIFIHISTDCVFNGETWPYSIQDLPDEKGTYWLSKYLGEVDGTIRTSIIGIEKGEPRNLLSWFLDQEYMAKWYTNVYWNGITTLTFAKICEFIIYRYLRLEWITQVSSERVSKCELLGTIAQVFDHPIPIAPTETKFSNKCLVSNAPKEIEDLICPLEIQLKDLKEFYGL